MLGWPKCGVYSNLGITTPAAVGFAVAFGGWGGRGWEEVERDSEQEKQYGWPL